MTHQVYYCRGCFCCYWLIQAVLIHSQRAPTWHVTCLQVLCAVHAGRLDFLMSFLALLKERKTQWCLQFTLALYAVRSLLSRLSFSGQLTGAWFIHESQLTCRHKENIFRSRILSRGSTSLRISESENIHCYHLKKSISLRRQPMLLQRSHYWCM